MLRTGGAKGCFTVGRRERVLARGEEFAVPCQRGVLNREVGTASRAEHRGGVELVLTAGACRR
jgi:hypothetical protein